MCAIGPTATGRPMHLFVRHQQTVNSQLTFLEIVLSIGLSVFFTVRAALAVGPGRIRRMVSGIQLLRESHIALALHACVFFSTQGDVRLAVTPFPDRSQRFRYQK